MGLFQPVVASAQGCQVARAGGSADVVGSCVVGVAADSSDEAAGEAAVSVAGVDEVPHRVGGVVVGADVFDHAAGVVDQGHAPAARSRSGGFHQPGRDVSRDEAESADFDEDAAAYGVGEVGEHVDVDDQVDIGPCPWSVLHGYVWTGVGYVVIRAFCVLLSSDVSV